MTSPSLADPRPDGYAGLGPEQILAAVEALGLEPDARILALNSYENRVFQVGMEGGAPLIAKFYRPGRWSDAQLLEEHAFAAELAAQEIPVIAPLVIDGQTLHQHAGYRFALYARRGGRWPELDDPDILAWLGRFLGRIHAVGAVRPFRHRARLGPEAFGHAARACVLAQSALPDYLREAYATVTADLLRRIDAAYAGVAGLAEQRIHGDCHPGNILWSDAGPAFVDLDDCCAGPPVQDLWMLLSGSRSDQTAQLDAVLEGYTQFADFDPRGLLLIEALRGLRMLHYAAWLTRRWSDPAFPLHFPWFNTPRYWEEHVLALREQLAAMDEPPLVWYG